MIKSININSKLILLVCLFFIFNNLSIFSQPGSGVRGQLSLQGKVVDNDGKSLRGASVQSTWLRDSTVKAGAVTDRDGKFSIENLRRGDHRIEVSFVGFKKLILVHNLTPDNSDLKTLKLLVNDVMLDNVTVEGQMVRQEQKDDTTIFNAGAFKVNPDASTEDLVRKMPGVTVDNDGTVKAHGEDIKKVLVDGKEFFGEDPKMALRSLPAEIIDKIQVYDKASDQAQFTGFDDGNSQKTLNIITKSDKNKGNFGKLYGGYGTEDRFWAGGNVNYFNKDTRISVIGLSNNINQQNFASQDVLSATGAQVGHGPGGAMRPGGGGPFRGRGSAGDFMVGQQNGISTTNSIGLNYADLWAEGLTFTGSYFMNVSNNDNNSVLSRNFFTQDESSQFYNEDNISGTDNYNHRFNGRLEYNIDSSNSLIIRPRLNLQSNSSVSSVDGSTIINNIPANQTINEYESDVKALNFENSLLYRFKFPTKGRTLSFEVETTINQNSGSTFLNSSNMIFDTVAYVVDLKQDGDIFGDGYKVETDVEYTEPVSENGIIQFSYEPTYTVSNSDKEIYNVDQQTANIRLLDSSLTNTYENIYLRQRGGLSYQYRTEQSNLSAGVEYQTAQLEGKQVFPYLSNTSYTFSNILPNLRYQYNFSKTTNFRLNFRTSTDAPSVTQLQDVVDNSNPVLLRIGNPDLKQNTSYTLASRVGSTDHHAASSIFGFVMLRFTDNYIANSTFTARKDTSINNIPMYAGSQLSRPVNLDGYIMGRSFFVYGIPLTLIPSNFNINAGLSYSRTPGLIDNKKNMADNFTINSGVVLSSNISPELDFTLSYNANYSIVKNSILPNQDNNYYISVANIKFNWIFWGGFVLNSEVFHNLYTGLDQDFNQEFLLWNASVGYKFLNNDAGELRLSVYDILGQNKSISRNVTEIYLEDQRTQVLQRYFMLTFTYNLRNFRN